MRSLMIVRLIKCCSGDQIEKNEMGRACSIYEGRGEVIQVLVGKPDGKRPLERPRRRWEDTIMMDLQKVGCEGVDWTELAQVRNRWRAFLNAVMNLWVP
jgi:hypothetical protein